MDNFTSTIVVATDCFPLRASAGSRQFVANSHLHRVVHAGPPEPRVDPSKEAPYQTLRPVFDSLGKIAPITIIDVGGYIGTFCIPVALCLSQDGVGYSIHSFEPGPTQDLLKINVDLNGLTSNVHVHDPAISDADGYGVYAFRKDGVIGGQVFTGQNTDTQRIVPTVTLDTFARQSLNTEGPLVIKVDTQGHEPDIMLHATEIIRNKRAVWLIEFMHWTGRKKYGDSNFASYLLDNFHVFDSNEKMARISSETMPALLASLEQRATMTDLLLVPRDAGFTNDVLASIAREHAAPASP